MNIASTTKIILRINPFKTLYFNLKFFDLSVALRLPVLIGWGVKFHNVSGRINIEGPITTGLVIISNSSSLDILGALTFKGKARLGRFSNIYVGPTGSLILGDNFWVTGQLRLMCKKEISFGKDCLLAWDIDILDTDFHKVKELDNIVNMDSKVDIGNHVWIGSRTTVLKGTHIQDNIIIGASSLVRGKLTENESIYAGSPAKLVKKGVKWEA